MRCCTARPLHVDHQHTSSSSSSSCVTTKRITDSGPSNENKKRKTGDRDPCRGACRPSAPHPRTPHPRPRTGKSTPYGEGTWVLAGPVAPNFRLPRFFGASFSLRRAKNAPAPSCLRWASNSPIDGLAFPVFYRIHRYCPPFSIAANACIHTYTRT